MLKKMPNNQKSVSAPKIDPNLKKINEQNNVLGNIMKDMDDDHENHDIR